MKLSNLYTEEKLSEANLLKGLLPAAFLRAKSAPNPKVRKIESLIKSISKDVYFEFYPDEGEQATRGQNIAMQRVESFASSIGRFIPELLQYEGEELRRRITELFVKRAAYKNNDPKVQVIASQLLST